MSNFPWESEALVLKVWSIKTLSADPRDYVFIIIRHYLPFSLSFSLRYTVEFFQRLHDVLYHNRLKEEGDRESTCFSLGQIKDICKNVKQCHSSH